MDGGETVRAKRGRPRKTDAPAGKPAAAPERIEVVLFKAADKMRGAMDAGEYKHVALGLIFLRYVSAAFERVHAELEKTEFADPEDPQEYEAAHVFWMPEDARWAKLRDSARKPELGTIIDAAMRAIEEANPALKGVLPKDFARPSLDKVMLGGLVDLFTNDIHLTGGAGDYDLLGRIYEYFLGGFAGAEGKRGGEFYTPSSVVRLMVEMLEPTHGRVYDPCCGTGGFFVQSERFVEAHRGKINDVAIYGQERNNTTWRLARMNMAIRRIDADIRWNSEGTLVRDALPDERFDTILANPPFNISDWGGALLREDKRWKHGVPPDGNANYAWLQHILHHLAPGGSAGVVLANGSMSSGQSGEGDIRRAMVEADVVDCMVALPGQIFYSTQIPACVWFLARNKDPGGGMRDRRGEVLFIDARKLGVMVDRTRKELTEADVRRVADAYHAWRGEPEAGAFTDVLGFCRAATLEEVRGHGHVLTPGRYVGAGEVEEEETSFEERFRNLKTELEKYLIDTDCLSKKIQRSLAMIKNNA